MRGALAAGEGKWLAPSNGRAACGSHARTQTHAACANSTNPAEAAVASRLFIKPMYPECSDVCYVRCTYL